MRLVLSLAAVLIGQGISLGQNVNLIQREIDSASDGLFRLGPFRVTPVLSFGADYDSNAFSSALVPQEDVAFRVGPGVSLSTPIGGSAVIDVYQRFDYIHYREQTSLSRLNDVTRLGGAVGGRRILFRIENDFANGISRPTTEFDVPVNSRSNNLSASLSLALSWRHELSFKYGNSRYQVKDDVPLDTGTVASRLNRSTDRYGVELTRLLTVKTRAIVEGFFERQAFDDPTERRDADSWGALLGIAFTPKGSKTPSLLDLGRRGLNGEFRFGFRRVEPVFDDRVDYKGLIGSADVTFGLGGANNLGVLYRRDVVPSIQSQNWYFVVNQVGLNAKLYIHRRFFLTPGVGFTRNDYPLPVERELPDGTVVVEELAIEFSGTSLGSIFTCLPSGSLPPTCSTSSGNRA